MRQYVEQKAQVSDALLLFRIGDFYETFYEDAETVSRVLGLTLTARNKSSDSPVPLAGVPYHAVDGYIAKLVRAGYKVAISEQVEAPSPAPPGTPPRNRKQTKGLMRREVRRIITPGTLTDEALLDQRSPNHLVALCPAGKGRASPAAMGKAVGSAVRTGNLGELHHRGPHSIPYGGPIGLACVELASGRFFAEMLTPDAVADELARLRPAELLVPEPQIDAAALPEEWQSAIGESPGARAAISPRPGHVFDPHTAEQNLCRHFGVRSLEGFGFDAFDASLCAAAAVLDYLQETQKSALGHVLKIAPRRPDRWVAIDQAALRSLEVERTMRHGARQGSLLDAVDMTVNPMGARRLREWLCYPLCNAAEIRQRQRAITDLLSQPDRLRRLRDGLREMGDIERMVARLGVGRASPRDMLALGRALLRCAELIEIIGAPVAPASQTVAPISNTVASGSNAVAPVSNPVAPVSNRCAPSTAHPPETSESTPQPDADLLSQLAKAIGGLDQLGTFLTDALKDDAPPILRDGGFIADGHDAELDRLRSVGADGRRWLAEYQAIEAARTGIPTLKVGYNSVFGYYLEVTHQHRDKVPPQYVRKQTVRNAERYITDELKKHENEVLGAADRAKQLELDLFEQIRSRAAADLPRLQAAAEAIGDLDVLGGLAELARRRDYCRPELLTATNHLAPGDSPGAKSNEGDSPGAKSNEGDWPGNKPNGEILEITDGRHPVLDVTLAERFVPNDCHLRPGRHTLGSVAPAACGRENFLIITGPNMAGKSTYIRQVALLVLLAQTGSYVPAKSMRWSLVDRIFARVGASDELARGHSTFMVEMVETTRILHNATSRSLVILDEIGRGTSTYDGLSLAWAITEHIVQRIGCRTLFATHYHELTELADRFERIANYNVAVREQLRPDGAGRDVVFLHKIVPGATDRSYGVHVAAMAGMPASVLKRSEVILEGLERGFGNKSSASRSENQPPPDSGQLSLFDETEPMPAWWGELVDRLGEVDIDRTAPLEALSILQRLKALLHRPS